MDFSVVWGEADHSGSPLKKTTFLIHEVVEGNYDHLNGDERDEFKQEELLYSKNCSRFCFCCENLATQYI